MAETWVLNDVLVITGTVVEYMEIGFTSNAKEWIAISVDSGIVLYAGTKDNLEVYQEERPQRWLDQAYRTITFDAAPTGELLTWLQANGVKQQDKHTNKVVVNGETILDLTQDTVTADKLVSGGTAHDKSGKQITGSMAEVDHFNLRDSTTSAVGNYFVFLSLPSDSAWQLMTGYVNKGTAYNTFVSKSLFGNATAADVAKGKTFTSAAAGLKVVGTAEGSSAADVTFELYNNGFNHLAVVYMSKTDGVMQTTIPNSDHMPITTSEGSMVALVNQDFDGNTINLVPDNGVSIAQGWRTANVTLFVAGAETNGMNIDVEIV